MVTIRPDGDGSDHGVAMDQGTDGVVMDQRTKGVGSDQGGMVTIRPHGDGSKNKGCWIRSGWHGDHQTTW